MYDLLSTLLLDSRQSGPLGAVILLGILAVILAIGMTSLRLLRGPTLLDRIVALDLISILLVALLTLFSLSSRVEAYLDAALILALVAFLSTVALARFVLRSGRDYGRDRNKENSP
jgi:multicomponent Na+:H+ antiporter subunit F